VTLVVIWTWSPGTGQIAWPVTRSTYGLPAAVGGIRLTPKMVNWQAMARPQLAAARGLLLRPAPLINRDRIVRRL